MLHWYCQLTRDNLSIQNSGHRLYVRSILFYTGAGVSQDICIQGYTWISQGSQCPWDVEGNLYMCIEAEEAIHTPQKAALT